MIKKLILGDCFEVLDDIEESSIDLVVTSPPYSDIKSYGKKINVLHPDNYVEWLLPLFNKIFRVLKHSGSFILNVDDKCVKKKRHIYCLDLAVRAEKETSISLYDYYIWYKRGGTLPTGGPRRLNHNTEFLFHFVKDVKSVKFNMDDVRTPYNKGTIRRVKSGIKSYDVDSDGKRVVSGEKKWKLNKKGKTPDNLLLFQTNSSNKEWKHPAPFHTDLPEWFIKALTDKNDIVLDPFVGSGSTVVTAEKLNRGWIGIDLNPSYIDMTRERLKTLVNLDPFFEEK